MGCPKAWPELVFIPLHSHPQNHGFASFFTPLGRGWGTGASGPLNNGSVSSARRSVRKEAEGRAKTCAAAGVALLRLQGGWERAVGESGRLPGHGRGVPGGAESPAVVRGRMLGGLQPVVSAELPEVRGVRARTATPPAPGYLSGVRVRGRVRFEIGLLSRCFSPLPFPHLRQRL